jgi:hypothetical protein
MIQAAAGEAPGLSAGRGGSGDGSAVPWAAAAAGEGPFPVSVVWGYAEAGKNRKRGTRKKARRDKHNFSKYKLIYLYCT